MQVDELGRRLIVERRFRVRHAGDRRDAAGEDDADAGRDRLVLLLARLAEVDMHVDQAGANNHAGRVDGSLRMPAGAGAEADDLVALDPQIVGAIEILGGIDESAVRDAQSVHEHFHEDAVKPGTSLRVPGESLPRRRRGLEDSFPAWASAAAQ